MRLIGIILLSFLILESRKNKKVFMFKMRDIWVVGIMPISQLIILTEIITSSSPKTFALDT